MPTEMFWNHEYDNIAKHSISLTSTKLNLFLFNSIFCLDNYIFCYEIMKNKLRLSCATYRPTIEAELDSVFMLWLCYIDMKVVWKSTT